jgi:hypothetical protein
VIVAGGGSGGAAAAVGAARVGARTLQLERGPCLGGTVTLRNVATYCGLSRERTARRWCSAPAVPSYRGSGTRLEIIHHCAWPYHATVPSHRVAVLLRQGFSCG